MMRIVTAGRYGSQVWAAVRGGVTLHGPLFAVKVYEARPRTKDGIVTWRLVRTLKTSFSVKSTAVKKAQKYAETKKLLFLPEVTHGARATLS